VTTHLTDATTIDRLTLFSPPKLTHALAIGLDLAVCKYPLRRHRPRNNQGQTENPPFYRTHHPTISI
jgi:hypothetical protein